MYTDKILTTPDVNIFSSHLEKLQFTIPMTTIHCHSFLTKHNTKLLLFTQVIHV